MRMKPNTYICTPIHMYVHYAANSIARAYGRSVFEVTSMWSTHRSIRKPNLAHSICLLWIILSEKDQPWKRRCRGFKRRSLDFTDWYYGKPGRKIKWHLRRQAEVKIHWYDVYQICGRIPKHHHSLLRRNFENKLLRWNELTFVRSSTSYGMATSRWSCYKCQGSR